jgi:hypothetical protein
MWEEPPQQAQGSMDCEYFAASYIARKLGHKATWEDVRRWKERRPRQPSCYPFYEFGSLPAWSIWDIPGQEQSNEEAIDKWRLGHAIGSPNFKEWVREYTSTGHIGYASYHAGNRTYNHAVPLLEANDVGVLIADSVHGLTRIPWKPFMDPYDSKRESAIVWAWYKLP